MSAGAIIDPMLLSAGSLELANCKGGHKALKTDCGHKAISIEKLHNPD
jgi:hypothetical protein